MSVLAPLTLLSHSNRARNMMISLLTETIVSYVQNETLSEQLSSVISNYLFVDFTQFYDIEEIESNINSKCVLFLTNLWVLDTDNDEEFIKEFDRKYGDNPDFFEYLKDHYWDCLMNLIEYQHDTEYKFLLHFIKKYNKFDRFPLKMNMKAQNELKSPGENICGIYPIIGSWLDDCVQIIDFMKYCNSFYADNFDINSIKTSWRNDHIGQLIKMKMVQQYIQNGEYDEADPNLLFLSIQITDYKLFEFSIKRYKNESILEFICDELKRNIAEILRKKSLTNDWEQYYHESNREFLRKIQKYCLESICKNDDDKEMLNQGIIDTWNIYAASFDDSYAKYKKW